MVARAFACRFRALWHFICHKMEWTNCMKCCTNTRSQIVDSILSVQPFWICELSKISWAEFNHTVDFCSQKFYRVQVKTASNSHSRLCVCGVKMLSNINKLIAIWSNKKKTTIIGVWWRATRITMAIKEYAKIHFDMTVEAEKNSVHTFGMT